VQAMRNEGTGHGGTSHERQASTKSSDRAIFCGYLKYLYTENNCALRSDLASFQTPTLFRLAIAKSFLELVDGRFLNYKTVIRFLQVKVRQQLGRACDGYRVRGPRNTADGRHVPVAT